MSKDREVMGAYGHKIEAADEILAHRIADTLNNHYPGHLWMVHVTSEGGVVVIKNLRISANYGMVIHLKNIYHDPNLKSVIRMGGEFLERAHMERGKATGDYAKVLEGALAKHQPKDGILF